MEKQEMTIAILKNIAQEYLKGDISLANLAAKYNLSKTTLIRYLNEEKEIKLPKDIQDKVNLMKAKRWKESKSTNGNKGKFSLTKDEIIDLAKKYIMGKELDLRDIAAFNGVAPATIYNLFNEENLGEELYLKVLEKYELNHPLNERKKHN